MKKQPKNDLKQLTALVRRFRDDRDWAQFHNPKDLALTLVLESAEVLEHMQWRNGRELKAHLKTRQRDVAHELADVLHLVLLLAEKLKVDLGKAFVEKMKLNAAKYPVHKARGSARKYTEL